MSDIPNKVNVPLRLPVALLARIDELAEALGSDRSSLIRDCILQGLTEIEERHFAADNKRRINRKLKMQADQIQKMLTVLEAPGTRPHERAEAVEAIRKASGM